MIGRHLQKHMNLAGNGISATYTGNGEKGGLNYPTAYLHRCTFGTVSDIVTKVLHLMHESTVRLSDVNIT